MNEAQRIRTALLASLSLREFSADDQLRLVDLTLGGLDDESPHRRLVRRCPPGLVADGGEDLVEVVERSFDDRPSRGMAEQGGAGAKLRPLTVEAGTESSHASDTESGLAPEVTRDDSPRTAFRRERTPPLMAP